nr:unnamed protein product [Digitaria exilis]
MFLSPNGPHLAVAGGGAGRVEGGERGGDEVGRVVVCAAVVVAGEGGGDLAGGEVADEAQRVVERAAVALGVPAAEGGGGDEAVPALADEGGAVETRWVVGRAADEHLLHGVVHQLRHAMHRRHGACLLASSKP